MVSMLPKKKKRLFVKNVKICKKEHSTESEGIRKRFWEDNCSLWQFGESAIARELYLIF